MVSQDKKTSGVLPELRIGDLVEVDCHLGKQKGIVLPSLSKDCIAIKLSSSGYNIGIKKEKITSITILRREEAKARAAAHSEEAPKQKISGAICILGCGGTIASRVDYSTGAVDASVPLAEIVGDFSKFSKASLYAKQIFSIASENMSVWHWRQIAKEAAEAINEGCRGIVITHGTDTMSFSSAALSFMLPNLPCPVVFTGSQRSTDRGSSDANANMRASLLAADADISGVFVCMHENLSDSSCLLHFGTRVRKMHTSRRDAFKSINSLPAARISLAESSVIPLSPFLQKRKEGKVALDDRMNENVALVYAYPGMKPSLIASLSSYDGVVIAGTGLGHVPVLPPQESQKSILDEVSALISSGVAVVITSQALYGRVNMSVYSSGRRLKEIGAIGHLCDMSPETAYVKLMWVLGREKRLPRVAELMETNIAGEISQRSDFEGAFL